MSKLENPVFQNIVEMIGGLIKKKKKKKLTIAPSKISVLKKFTALPHSSPVEIPISYFPKKRPVGRPRRLYDEDAPKVRRRTKAQIAIDEAEAIRQAEEFGKVTAVRRLKTNPLGTAFRQKVAEKRAEQKAAKVEELRAKNIEKAEQRKKAPSKAMIEAFRRRKEAEALLLPEFDFPVSKVPRAKPPRALRRTHAEQDAELDILVEKLNKNPGDIARLIKEAKLTKYQKEQLAKPRLALARPAKAVGELKEEEEDFLPLALPESPKGKAAKPSPKRAIKPAPLLEPEEVPALAKVPAKASPKPAKAPVKKSGIPVPGFENVGQPSLTRFFGKAEAPAKAEGKGRFRKRRKY
jgi:hypothetical protein